MNQIEEEIITESNPSSKGIKSWPESERPREKLFSLGAGFLADAELLAILLRTGIKGKDAISLARELLIEFGGLRGLFSATSAQLLRVKGLGQAKIAVLISTLELARRQLKQEIVGKNFVRDPKSIMDYLYSSLRDRKQEIFKVIYLNKAGCILGDEDLFTGTVDESAVHPREVLKSALEKGATAIILIHNHPSGRIFPSREDQEITRRIESVALPLGIRVLDHIIVGDNHYFSFKDQKLLM